MTLSTASHAALRIAPIYIPGMQETSVPTAPFSAPANGPVDGFGRVRDAKQGALQAAPPRGEPH